MGLDMFAYATSEKLATVVDFDRPDEAEEVHYWRKHPNLHGWMQALYVEKGGENPEFNMSPVVLTEDDLDRLEQAIRGQRLPETSGFFFGESDGLEVEDDLHFVAKARQVIQSGRVVFYTSWW